MYNFLYTKPYAEFSLDIVSSLCFEVMSTFIAFSQSLIVTYELQSAPLVYNVTEYDINYYLYIHTIIVAIMCFSSQY